jgi:hypothetical protein
LKLKEVFDFLSHLPSHQRSVLMTQLFKGMIIGSAITAAALAGYAYGTSAQQAPAPETFDSEDLERANCSVRVGFGRISVGSECRNDQVMVGYQSSYLLCADLTVTCP